MMRRREIHAVEGKPISGLSPSEARELDRARKELTARLRPTLALFKDTAIGVVPTNVVGTVRLNANTVVRVQPKVGAGDDWVGAALDLMVPERASLAGHRQATLGGSRRTLETGLAAIYDDRLGRALRAEGPIEVTHPQFAWGGSLDGQLDVERWSLGRNMGNLSFPVHRTVLDADNEFSEALAFAAALLSRSSVSGLLRTSLSKLAHDLRPGLPEVLSIDPGVVGRPLPQQWSRYTDAWSIAQVVLARSGFSTRRGSLAGVEVALEPWKLLEELLDRTLNRAVATMRGEGVCWENSRQRRFPVLCPGEEAQGPLLRLVGDRYAIPENVITGSDGPVATFEAKYTRPTGPRAIREHIYQAITTAAYAESPVAVLIYPELAEPVHWRTANKRTSVRDVYAVGLDLFGYSARRGLQERADALLRILRSSPAPSPRRPDETGVGAAPQR